MDRLKKFMLRKFQAFSFVAICVPSVRGAQNTQAIYIPAKRETERAVLCN